MKILALLLALVGCSDMVGIAEWRARCALRSFSAVTQDSAVEWSTLDTSANNVVIEFTGVSNSGAARVVDGQWWAVARSPLGTFTSAIIYGSMQGSYADYDGEFRMSLVDDYGRTHWLTQLIYTRSGDDLAGRFEDWETSIRVGFRCR